MQPTAREANLQATPDLTSPTSTSLHYASMCSHVQMEPTCLNRSKGTCSMAKCLSNLLNLMRTLLVNHEVKICMDVLDALATSLLEQVEIDYNDLKDCVLGFADSQRIRNGHSFAAIKLLEKIVEEWQVPTAPISRAKEITVCEPLPPPPLLSGLFSTAMVRSFSENSLSSQRFRVSDETQQQIFVHSMASDTSSLARCQKDEIDCRNTSDASAHKCVTTPKRSLLVTQSSDAPSSLVAPQCSRASLASTKDTPTTLQQGPSLAGNKVVQAESETMGVQSGCVRSQTLCEVDCQVSLFHDLDSLTREQEFWLATKSDWFIMHPNSVLRIFWDTFALLLIVAECITLPLAIGFGVQVDGAYQNYVTAFFIIDLMLSFTTGYFHGQLLVMRRSLLTMKYLRTWFAIDVICLIPWDLLISEFNSLNDGGTTTSTRTTILRVVKFGKLFRVIRLTRAAKTGTLLKRLQAEGLLSASLYEYKFVSACARMFVTFGFLSHWGACIWSFISSASVDDVINDDCAKFGSCFVESPWVPRFGLDHHDTITKYMVAFHYLIALICGGECPVTPGTHAERVFTVLVLMWAIFITSVVVGEVLLIMEYQKKKTMAFDEQTASARQFMVARQIPLRLQGRVYRYLAAQQKSIMSGDIGWNREFMTSLSDSLQTDLLFQLNRHPIRRHPFFKSLASSSPSLKQICLVAKSYVYAGGDIIVKEGMPATSIIFIVRGKVQLKKRVGRAYVLFAPCWHSERCLFYDFELRTHTLVAVNTVETLLLEKTLLLESFDCDPVSKKRYECYCEELRDNDLSSLFCLMCGEWGHTIETCQHSSERPGMPASQGIKSRFSSERLVARSRTPKLDRCSSAATLDGYG